MTRFPCPKCKAILHAGEQQASVRCPNCRLLTPAPQALPDWLTAAAAPPPPPVVASQTSLPRLPPVSRKKERPASSSAAWIAIGGGSAGLLLLIAVGTAVLAFAAKGKQPQGGEAAPRRVADNTEPVVKEIPTYFTPPVEKPAEPVKKPDPPAPPPAEKPPPAPPVVEKKPDPPPVKEEKPVVVKAPAKTLGPPKPTIKPKPLGKNVLAGLNYLTRVQSPDGSWVEGAESERPNHPASKQPSVAHTSLAALAFLRSGASPTKGTHSTRLSKAAAFVCSRVEKAPAESLSLFDDKNPFGGAKGKGPKKGGLPPGIGMFPGGPMGGNGPYIQTKLGRYIDTYCALWFLAEIKGRLADEKANARADKALAKLVAKMEKHQAPDGGWECFGISPGLGMALAAKGLNRARQVGVAVDEKVLAKAQKCGLDYFDRLKKSEKALGKGGPAPFAPGMGMGFNLYSTAGHLGLVQDALATTRQADYEASQIAQSPGASEEEKKSAQGWNDRRTQMEKSHREAVNRIVKRLTDDKFLKALGSYGGEEFIGYQVIGESLVASKSTEWAKWDKFVTGTLTKMQNRDGSWSGGHCLTGRNVCTAAALLALMADRSPVLNAAE
jgi:outer membrane biosynthesis protein TonB